MADQINRIGGGGYVQQEEELLQEQLEQSQELEESGSSQAANQVANGQQANAAGQPAGPKAGEQAEQKPAPANAPLEEHHHHHHHLQQQRRAAQTTPRKPTRPGSKKDEKALDDGIDHLDELPDEMEAARFEALERAGDRESGSGQEGDSRLAAADEEETAARAREATDGGASGTGKSSPAKDLGSGTAATSGSPGSVAKTEVSGRESVKTPPAATGQTGSSPSPALSKAQASGRPAPDSQKLTPDSAASVFNRDRLKFAATQGNPRASHGATLGRPASPISLKQLKNGEFVPWGLNRSSSLNVAPGPVGLAPDSMKLNAESVASQLSRARVKAGSGNRRASYGTMVANARVPSNAPLPGKVARYSGDLQLRKLQADLYRGR